MKPEEIKRIRESLGLDRHELAELLCLSGYRTLMNIELGSRKPNKLAVRVLRYLDSLPHAKAKKFMEEISKHEPE